MYPNKSEQIKVNCQRRNYNLELQKLLKEVKAFAVILLSNITVFADILIILVFASLLTSGTDQIQHIIYLLN